MNPVRLPESIKAMIATLGEPIAWLLVEHFGGLSLKVPLGSRTGGLLTRRLIEVLGEADARRVMETYGGEIVYIPACRAALRDVRDQRIIDGYAGGASVAQLAAQHQLSARQVEKILKRTPGEAGAHSRLRAFRAPTASAAERLELLGQVRLFEGE